MDRIILRTLTHKSKLRFIPDNDLTVADLIDLNEHAFLIESYYIYSKINYSEDVLKELGIDETMRIAKPGKDPVKGYEILRKLSFSDHEKRKSVRDRILKNLVKKEISDI